MARANTHREGLYDRKRARLMGVTSAGSSVDGWLYIYPVYVFSLPRGPFPQTNRPCCVVWVTITTSAGLVGTMPCLPLLRYAPMASKLRITFLRPLKRSALRTTRLLNLLRILHAIQW